MGQRRTKVEVLNEKISKVDSRLLPTQRRLQLWKMRKLLLQLSWRKFIKQPRKQKKPQS